MISFALPRFCDSCCRDAEADPLCRRGRTGSPSSTRSSTSSITSIPSGPASAAWSAQTARTRELSRQRFFEDVVGMVQQYLSPKPDPRTYEFLQYNFAELERTLWRRRRARRSASFPSYPQRYTEVLIRSPRRRRRWQTAVSSPLKRRAQPTTIHRGRHRRARVPAGQVARAGAEGQVRAA